MFSLEALAPNTRSVEKGEIRVPHERINLWREIRLKPAGHVMMESDGTLFLDPGFCSSLGYNEKRTEVTSYKFMIFPIPSSTITLL